MLCESGMPIDARIWSIRTATMFVSRKRLQLFLKVLLAVSVIGVYFIVLLRESFAAWESTSTASILSTSDALAKVKNGIADQVINCIPIWRVSRTCTPWMHAGLLWAPQYVCVGCACVPDWSDICIKLCHHRSNGDVCARSGYTFAYTHPIPISMMSFPFGCSCCAVVSIAFCCFNVSNSNCNKLL